MSDKNRNKIIILGLVLAHLLLANLNLAFAADPTSTPAYSGPESTIKALLCTPSFPADQNDLYNCINKIYKFAIAASTIVAVLFIVIAGYLYMGSEGNQETVDKAKSMLTSSIAALVILFAGYILLRTLNPDIIQLKSIQPPSITGVVPSTAAGCNNCVSLAGMNIPLKAGQGTMANSALASKLQQLAQNNKTWQVNEAYPPVVAHGDPCHADGTCADIALTGTATNQALAQLCTDAKAASLSVYNEYDTQTTGTDSSSQAFVACGQSQNPATKTGNNLHVK